jgi:hypothetical protein
LEIDRQIRGWYQPEDLHIGVVIGPLSIFVTSLGVVLEKGPQKRLLVRSELHGGDRTSSAASEDRNMILPEAPGMERRFGPEMMDHG